jgi:dipeptidyl aminopeptidase/acylaminoacyl peptidase
VAPRPRGYEPIVQWLANRGYAVLQVNFRGSTGIAQGYADASRLAIFGGSYGGYAVLTALAWTPDEFCCGVDIVGPSDLRTFLAAIPAYWEPMRRLLSERIGDDPDLLAAQSPLGKASSIRSPLLIVHGANDPRVRRQESDQIVSVLRAKGTPVEYMVLDDEGHGRATRKPIVRPCAPSSTNRENCSHWTWNRRSSRRASRGHLRAANAAGGGAHR